MYKARMDNKMSSEEKVSLLRGLKSLAVAIGDEDVIEDFDACIAILDKRIADDGTIMQCNLTSGSKI
jgi:hypothetical protein